MKEINYGSILSVDHTFSCILWMIHLRIAGLKCRGVRLLNSPAIDDVPENSSPESLSPQTPQVNSMEYHQTPSNNQSISPYEPISFPFQFIQETHSSKNPIQSPPPSPSHPTSSSLIPPSHPQHQSIPPSVPSPLKSPQFCLHSRAVIIPLPLPSAIVVVIRGLE